MSYRSSRGQLGHNVYRLFTLLSVIEVKKASEVFINSFHIPNDRSRCLSTVFIYLTIKAGVYQ